MRRIEIAVCGVLLVLAASCSKKPVESEAGPLVQGIKLMTVTPESFEAYYEAVGTVRSKNSSVIAARITGNIVAIHVHEGDRVRKGQALVEIENRDAGIQVQKAQAGLREAQNALDEVERDIHAAEAGREAARANETLATTTFNRYKTLFDRRSVSPQEFDEVRAKRDVAMAERARAERLLQAVKAKQKQMLARIDQAKADVSNAQVYSGYARLISPINGVVVAKQIDVGSLATPGAPLLRIEDESQYQLEVSVEESQLSNIHLQDEAKVQIDAIGKRDLSCAVKEIVPTSDPNSRSYLVRVDLPSDAGLRSGLFGKARFRSGQRQAVVVPQAAVTERGQLVGVFVVDESGLARLRLIKTGDAMGERVEVLSGLTSGEQIVAENPAAIQDGMRVREPPPAKNKSIAAR